MTTSKYKALGYLRTAVCAVAIGASTSASAFTSDGVGELPSEMTGPTLTPRTPAVGTLSGVHLAIPHEYLLFGVAYKGESAMDPKPREKAPDLNTPIDNFSMLLRLSDLEPRRSPEDERRWETDMNSSGLMYSHSWMTVDVHSLELPDYGADWVKKTIGWHLAMKNQGGDVYEDAPAAHGLSRMITTHLGPAPSFETQHDMLYDKERKITFITCSHMRKNVEPHTVETQCIQTFHVDDLHARVDLRYDDIYIKNWRFYQQRISELLRSFAKSANDVSLSHEEQK